jgi:hypothetical protein
MKHIIVMLTCLAIAFPALAENYEKQDKQKNLPPGLQKKLERTGELPPGWEKKLRRGEVLDIDLYEYGTPVDGEYGGYEYEHRPGTELLRIEDKILRITKNTREILEIMGIGKHN